MTRPTRNRSGLRWAALFAGVSVLAAIWDQAVIGFLFVALSAGGLIVAMIFPDFLAPADAALDHLSRGVGILVTVSVLASVYFLVVTPIGLVRRSFRTGRRSSEGSYWVAYPKRQSTHDHYEHMF